MIDLSPKSAATLARRCLQAIIRNFCGITRRSLNAEIEALRVLAEADELPRGVEPETIAAMDALREVGNIGAHMMENGGEILEVDSGEAEALLGSGPIDLRVAI